VGHHWPALSGAALKLAILVNSSCGSDSLFPPNYFSARTCILTTWATRWQSWVVVGPPSSAFPWTTQVLCSYRQQVVIEIFCPHLTSHDPTRQRPCVLYPSSCAIPDLLLERRRCGLSALDRCLDRAPTCPACPRSPSINRGRLTPSDAHHSVRIRPCPAPSQPTPRVRPSHPSRPLTPRCMACRCTATRLSAGR